MATHIRITGVGGGLDVSEASQTCSRAGKSDPLRVGPRNMCFLTCVFNLGDPYTHQDRKRDVHLLLLDTCNIEYLCNLKHRGMREDRNGGRAGDGQYGEEGVAEVQEPHLPGSGESHLN